MGFEFIQLNTNGLRLGNGPGISGKAQGRPVSRLYSCSSTARATASSGPQRRKFLEAKMRAIENCRDMDLGVVLVPTLVRG